MDFLDFLKAKIYQIIKFRTIKTAKKKTVLEHLESQKVIWPN